MEIRKAKVADAKALRDAEADTAATPGLLVSRPDELQVAHFERTIRELDPLGLYLVAESDGQVVGHALLEPMKLAAVSHVFHLTIVVHPGHRGRGIGTALLEELLRRAQELRQVEKVELRVRSTNETAIRLYKRVGFAEEGRFERRVKLRHEATTTIFCEPTCNEGFEQDRHLQTEREHLVSAPAVSWTSVLQEEPAQRVHRLVVAIHPVIQAVDTGCDGNLAARHGGAQRA